MSGVHGTVPRGVTHWSRQQSHPQVVPHPSVLYLLQKKILISYSRWTTPTAEALLSPALTGAARALPARQRRKKIQALIFQQTLNKAEEKEG